MLWIKAFHIISMVAWFSGLFYLPRLFVYHAQSSDTISKERFKIMERKLYYYITTPAALLTLGFGIALLSYAYRAYMQMKWIHLKLGLVLLLVIFHIYLGKLLRDFKYNRNQHSDRYYRWVNEIPSVLLIGIVLLAVLKPIF